MARVEIPEGWNVLGTNATYSLYYVCGETTYRLLGTIENENVSVNLMVNIE